MINVATDNGPPKILRRSIKQLIPIEVTSSDERDLDKSTELSGNDIVNVDRSVNTADQLTHSQISCSIGGDSSEKIDWTLNLFAPNRGSVLEL